VNSGDSGLATMCLGTAMGADGLCELPK